MKSSKGKRVGMLLLYWSIVKQLKHAQTTQRTNHALSIVNHATLASRDHVFFCRNHDNDYSPEVVQHNLQSLNRPVHSRYRSDPRPSLDLPTHQESETKTMSRPNDDVGLPLDFRQSTNHIFRMASLFGAIKMASSICSGVAKRQMT